MTLQPLSGYRHPYRTRLGSWAFWDRMEMALARRREVRLLVLPMMRPLLHLPNLRLILMLILILITLLQSLTPILRSPPTPAPLRRVLLRHDQSRTSSMYAPSHPLSLWDLHGSLRASRLRRRLARQSVASDSPRHKNCVSICAMCTGAILGPRRKGAAALRPLALVRKKGRLLHLQRQRQRQCLAMRVRSPGVACVLASASGYASTCGMRMRRRPLRPGRTRPSWGSRARTRVVA